MLSANGTLLDRWPTNLESVPAGLKHYVGPGAKTTPGRELNALDCPPSFLETGSLNACPGDVTASEDLSHFVFATEWNPFTPDGQLSPPGSVYDNDIRNRVTVASSFQRQTDPSEPGDRAGDPLANPRGLERRQQHPDGRRGDGAMRLGHLPDSPCGTFFGYTPPLSDAAQPSLHAGRRSGHL